jgi:hypothetical protein
MQFSTFDPFVSEPRNFMTSPLILIAKKPVTAVLDDVRQSHDREVMDLYMPKNQVILNRFKPYHTYCFSRKRSQAKLKGADVLGCADGRKQQITLNNDAVRAPIAALESVVSLMRISIGMWQPLRLRCPNAD